MLIDWTLELDAPNGRARLAGTSTNWYAATSTAPGGWSS
jgi:hypothetical protein